MIHAALFALIVDPDPVTGAHRGPSATLYDESLPPGSPEDVAVPLAVVTTPGAGAEFHLGDGQWADGSRTSGMLWEHTGLQFEARAGRGKHFAARKLLDLVMRRMLTLRAGTTTLPADLGVAPWDQWETTHGVAAEQRELHNCELTSGPFLLDRDKEQRATYALTMELWHSPVRA